MVTKSQSGKVDLSPPDLADSAPARSETQSVGAKERSTMRKVALDIGGRKIAACEVADGQVVHRSTVSGLHLLEFLLGPEQPPDPLRQGCVVRHRPLLDRR